MKKYKYKIVSESYRLEDSMNSLGEKGWEVFQVIKNIPKYVVIDGNRRPEEYLIYCRREIV